MVFEAKDDNYGFAVDVNQSVINPYNGWLSGVVMTEVALNVQVSLTAGELVFQGVKHTITGQTVTLDAAEAVLTRRDLIAYNGTTFVVLKGTPQDDTNTIAKPPYYDIDAYVIVGMVKVRPAVTEFDSTDLTDYRVRGLVAPAESAHPFLFM